MDRATLLKKYDGRCAYCGEKITLKTMQKDHLLPLRRGDGPPDKKLLEDDNLMPSCAPCNRWKSVLSIEEFRHEIHEQPMRVFDKSAGYRMAIRFGILQQTLEPIKFYFEKVEMKYGHG